jgi:hypothetical protein
MIDQRSDEVLDRLARPAHGPVVSGDEANGGVIEAFRFDHLAHGSARDLAALRRDGALEWPPLDTIVATRRAGAPAALRLEPRLVRPAHPHERDGVEQIIARHHERWPAMARATLQAIGEAAYEVWLIGGSSRDVVRGEAGQANDLDLAGTMPAGRFFDLVSHIAEGTGYASMTGAQAVVRLLDHDLEPIIEYKPLEFALPDHEGPLCDHDLVFDVSTRDLTFNSIFYDLHNHLVLDPTGSGVDDALTHTFRPCGDGPPDAAIRNLLRWLKFARRYEERGVVVAPACEALDARRDLLCEAATSLRDHPKHLEITLNKFYGTAPPDKRGPQDLHDAARILGETACLIVERLVGP